MAKRNPQQSLRDWTKQEWMTSETYKNKKKGSSKEVKSEGKKRYLPKAAWSALSESEKKATNLAKSKGNKAGKQFVSQPKSIAKKVSKYRGKKMEMGGQMSSASLPTMLASKGLGSPLLGTKKKKTKKK